MKANPSPMVKARAGFTLIEVLVAFFIISVSAGAILLGVVLSMRQSTDSREQIMAQILASSTVDELRAHRYGSHDPPPGWISGASGWTREVDIASVVGGLAAPTEFALTLTPAAEASDPNSDTVNLSVQWTETSGPRTLSFAVPMPKGWNQGVQRGVAPSAVASNWHEPAAYTIPTEPSYRIGDKDHTVDPQVPDSGNIINGDTAHLHDLVAQLNAAQTALDKAEEAVARDQGNISDTQAALTQAQGAAKPDQAAISQLQAQLATEQGQLAKDQANVTTLQTQVNSLKQQIANG